MNPVSFLAWSRLSRRFRARPLLALTLVFTGAAAVPVRAAEWVLVYRVTDEVTITSPEANVPPRTEHRAYTETIALTPTCLVVQDDRQKQIRDFAHRRWITLNLADQTFDDWPLCGLVDFLAAELNNRNALGAGLRAAKIDQASLQFERFDSETELRLESAPHPRNAPAPRIEQVNVGQVIEFRHGDRTVVRFTPSDTTLPAAFQPRFVNFLAYHCAIHPQIRAALVAAQVLPRELVFTSNNLNRRTTTTMELTSASLESTDHRQLPPAATPALHGGEPVFALIAKVREAERTGHRPTRTEAIAFADAAIAAGRPLDGLMALLEFGLQSGEQLGAEIRQRRATFALDAACTRYLQAFAQSSQAECEQGLAANAMLSRDHLQRGYMLDLQRANHLDRLHRVDEALACYVKVIEANPFHAGALHDLGLLLANTYEHIQAWLCWDTARRLYPDHPMFRDITEREHRLVATCPDFF